jgi:uncharacterized protein (DUF302 family)
MSLLARTLAAVLLSLPVALLAAPPSGAKIRSTKGSFEDVKARVILAIENRGLVINYTARIGEMLDRTGKDIGRTRAIYGNAEMYEFCSAAVSRDMLEADPHNIIFCPYAIAVYTLPKQPGRVFVSFRKPYSIGETVGALSLAKVEKLLEDIVRDALR